MTNFPNDVKQLSMCLLAIHILVFAELFILICCSFQNWVIIEVQEFFIYSKYKSFGRYIICKYFLPVLCDLSFFNGIFKKFLFIIIYNFIFWLPWVLVAAHGLSLVVARENYSALCSMGISLRWLVLLQRTVSRTHGLQQLLNVAQQLWLTDLGALWHVESSQTKEQIHVPCTGRRILKQ